MASKTAQNTMEREKFKEIERKSKLRTWLIEDTPEDVVLEMIKIEDTLDQKELSKPTETACIQRYRKLYKKYPRA